MSFLTRFFGKPASARAAFGGQPARIGKGVSGDPIRLRARLERLRKSAARASGDRRVDLDSEIAAIDLQFEQLRAALNDK